ncbi:MAG: hypothetical protein IT456_23365 [Planctomycetes bacterium]|nr:hypothetical protein [Planctomycetota bacterium]
MACKNSKIDHKKLAADLRLLASRFETTANALLVGAPSRPAIGDARDHMTEAGRALLKLVISGFLAQPSTVPPWLKLSIRSGSRRPRFVGSRIQTEIGVVEEIDYKGATLAEVLGRKLNESDAVRKYETHRASDLRLGNVRRRLVFLEAATGWLADRFHVKPRIHPSMCSLLVRDATGRSRIGLCFDWLDEEDPGTSSFFMSVCRNGSRICSGLASMLEEAVSPVDQPRSSSTQPPAGGQPELEEYVPPAVDWAAERAQLVEEGDTEGAMHLDNLLASPRRCEHPIDGVVKGHEGQPDRKVVRPPLTDEAILEALRNRRWLQGQRAELRKILDVDATTPAGICARWRGFAALAPKFARHLGGREVIHFGMVDGKFGPVNAARMYPGAPGEEKAPELAWAEAFRESTSSLVTLVLDAKVEDVPVQRLLQGLDEVLDGKGVELGPNIREVDVLVRVIAARVDHPQAANTNGSQVVNPDAKELHQGKTSAHSDRGEPTAQADDTLEFDKIEKAVVLLIRDGQQPRSMREYAKDVGLHHATLSRNENWRRAWEASKEAAKADTSKMPQGSKDKDGNMEAWTTEVCENCRQQPIACTRIIRGGVVRMCEQCASKHPPRTNPRTTG